jgi:ABC-type multidrug transport system ATPase subunit
VEEPSFYAYLSGRANLELLSEIDDRHGIGVEDALDRVGLSRAAGERVAGYSTGMRQRLGIAAALLRSPRVLLLDEPTSGLDPEGTRAASTLFRELAGEGVAVLVSSHLIGELEAICDSYTIVSGGRVVWDGAAARLEAEAPGSVYLLSTSEDGRALALADTVDGIEARVPPDLRGVHVTARPGALDSYAVALGREGIAVRRLELVMSPLESMFFNHVSTYALAGVGLTRPGRLSRVLSAARIERRKLASQLPLRLLIVITALGPIVFAVLLQIQSGTPADALFGVWVHTSGVAGWLVVLGFAGTWGFPIIAGALAGDLFASEDRRGTWKTILTRSRTVGELFAGKVIAAATFGDRCAATVTIA